MDYRAIVSIFLCILPQILSQGDQRKLLKRPTSVEVNSENIVYYSEEDIKRLIRQTPYRNNRPVAPVVPAGEEANAPQSQQPVLNLQNQKNLQNPYAQNFYNQQDSFISPQYSPNQQNELNNKYPQNVQQQNQQPSQDLPKQPNNQHNPQNAIVYRDEQVNQQPLEQRTSIFQRPFANFPFRINNGVQTTTTAPFKVPLEGKGPNSVRPTQNEVLPGPVQPPYNRPENVNPPLVPLSGDSEKSSVGLVNFGLDMLQATQKTRGRIGNVVASPYSIATMLALLQQGAYGLTQRQISEALQMSPENSAAIFKKYSDAIRKRVSRNILRVATNIFIAPSFTLNPAFKTTAINNFGSDITPLDFSRPDAVQMINGWVSSKTERKIENLLSPESVNQHSQMILANAIYFKGSWQTMFDPQSTELKDFSLANGQKKKVPYMKMRRHFKTGIDFSMKSQVLILPFEDELYSLMLVLPSENVKLDSVIQALEGKRLLGYNNLPSKEVQIEIPKFTIRDDIELVGVLHQLGVSNIFNQNSELFGIANYRNYSALISTARHSALLSIDEKGGSAAAATAFAVIALSYEDPSDYFRANRPFLAVLWNNELATPMFMAKVEDPSQ